MKNEKIITSIIIFVLASLFLFITFDFPANKARDVGPGFLPQIYAAALYILGIALFIQGLKDKKEEKPAMKNIALVFLSMFVAIVYVSLISTIGFYIITPIIMIILLLITKVKKVLTIILVPAATTLFIFVFFEKMLKVPVPTGIFFN